MQGIRYASLYQNWSKEATLVNQLTKFTDGIKAASDKKVPEHNIKKLIISLGLWLFHNIPALLFITISNLHSYV